MLGLLVALREHLDCVTRMKFLAHLYDLAVDLSANARIADIGMDTISEVEHRRVSRELEKVTTGRKDIDVIGLQRHLKLVHDLQVVACL